MGMIPAGEYKFTEDGVKAVLAAGLTAQEIRHLILLLEESHDTPSLLAFPKAAAEHERPAVDPAVIVVIRGLLPSDPTAARTAKKALATALATLLVAGGAVEVAHHDAQQAHADAQDQTAATERIAQDIEQKVPQIVQDAVRIAMQADWAAEKLDRRRLSDIWRNRGLQQSLCLGGVDSSGHERLSTPLELDSDLLPRHGYLLLNERRVYGRSRCAALVATPRKGVQAVGNANPCRADQGRGGTERWGRGW
jgi:hypothetical protein